MSDRRDGLTGGGSLSVLALAAIALAVLAVVAFVVLSGLHP
jgi:hypothetical protein